MTRLFYVHTPRNRYNESLVRRGIHSPGYTIRNVLDSTKKDFTKPMKTFSKVEARCKAMNDAHEASMMAGMI